MAACRVRTDGSPLEPRRMTLLAAGRDTNASFALIDFVAPNDTGRHVHEHEAFHVLEGVHEVERR